MSVATVDVQKLDTDCSCGCENCRAQKEMLLQVVELLGVQTAPPSAAEEEKEQQASAVPVKVSSSETGEVKRKRGQQPKAPGHGRRSYEHLPLGEEVLVPPPITACTTCGTPFRAVPELLGSSDELELEIRVRRRRTQRPALKPACACPGNPPLVQAPAPPKLIPRGLFTTSTVVWLLTLKFSLAIPPERVSAMLGLVGAPVATGTVAGVFERVAPLLAELAAPIREHTAGSPYLHTDEASWRLLGPLREEWERPFGWNWVLVGTESISYLIAETRAASMLFRHLQLDPEGTELPPDRELVLCCDRYSGNMSVARQYPEILLSICWQHVRDDFVELADRPGLRSWVEAWLLRIKKLYRAHHAWNACPEPDGSLAEQELHEAVEAALSEIEKAKDTELESMHDAAAGKVLASMDRFWEGLQTPTLVRRLDLDNNPAERAFLLPALVKKNSLGSAADWSAQLAADFWTVTETAKLNGLDPLRYLTDFFEACVEAGDGKGAAVPENLHRFLPYQAAPADRARWARSVDTS